MPEASVAGRFERGGMAIFKAKDFASLALSLRQTVATHEVPPALRASLIEDVIFRVAVLIDEKTGSDFHESIFAVLRKYAKAVRKPPEPADSLLTEVEIIFHKGRKAELNVLRSSIAKPRLLRQILEIALGIRDTSELTARIDAERRFADVLRKKSGVKAVRFKRANAAGGESWQEVKTNGSPRKAFDRSIDGLLACIRGVAIRASKS